MGAGQHADAEHPAEPLPRAPGHGHLLPCSQALQLLLEGTAFSAPFKNIGVEPSLCCLNNAEPCELPCTSGQVDGTD